MNIKEVLKQFCMTGAPAGAESEAYHVAKAVMAPFGDCYTDQRGNFICRKEGEGMHFLLDAHLDQIGFVVTSIEKNGFLRVDKVGGIDRRTLPSLEVEILAKEKIYGVIASKPPHLSKDSEGAKAPVMEEIAIDTGLSEEELKQTVSLGDKVYFRPHFCELLNGNISAVGVDDRAGMAIIARVMELLLAADSCARISAVFSVGEEVAGKGAVNASYAAQADEAVVVDVSFAAQPEVDSAHQHAVMPLGSGAFIGVAPILSSEMSQQMIQIAKENDIPYAVEVLNGTTGTNADGIAVARYGTKTVCVSPPIRNMHTAVEVVNLGDLEHCARLIAAYILSKEGKSCII